MIAPVFLARVDDAGKLTLLDPDQFKRHIQTLRAGPVEVVVRQRKARRSDPQNRYYWGVVIELLAEATGYTKDEMHDALKYKFLRDEAETAGLPKIGSTATLNTAGFEQYLERVRTFASAELGVYIPEPNEVEMVA